MGCAIPAHPIFCHLSQMLNRSGVFLPYHSAWILFPFSAALLRRFTASSTRCENVRSSSSSSFSCSRISAIFSAIAALSAFCCYAACSKSAASSASLSFSSLISASFVFRSSNCALKLFTRENALSIAARYDRQQSTPCARYGLLFSPGRYSGPAQPLYSISAFLPRCPAIFRGTPHQT